MDCWFMSPAGLIKNYPYEYRPDYYTFQYPKAFRDRKDPCHWVPTRDGLGVEWFYNRRWTLKSTVSFGDAVFWIQWIADNILKPWGLTLEGEVWYQASNSVWLAKTLPREQLGMRDPFGRTPLMLAAWFKSHEMLDWLSTQLQDDTWQLDALFAREVCAVLCPEP
ncbi:hypothetical protein KFL_000350240 [Klebsormidium nitens]|uniref:Uncharacterized protein n=1 Tax=Klebsormidium nitens TaxID=105231 RepID=A0A1Y1HM26_KLENI|nr:hypothetical protein KFL_000350240 [Klebsormidium nitens]|eukprot:GAQ79670.1 hypothetical protein KFL_000350240 [Klebsormidium nitens]